MPKKSRTVGITGGIGSGKSIVCKVFETLGAKTYYADDRAKWLMEHDAKLVSSIKDAFGSEAYVQSKLNRSFLASKVFRKKELLNRLNELVHPSVASDFKEWEAANSSEKLLLKEAALLFETESYEELAQTILVTAPQHIRVQRVLKRDPQRTEDEVLSIIEKQLRDEEKIPLADYVVVNDGKDSVIKQVADIYRRLIIA